MMINTSHHPVAKNLKKRRKKETKKPKPNGN